MKVQETIEERLRSERTKPLPNDRFEYGICLGWMRALEWVLGKEK